MVAHGLRHFVGLFFVTCLYISVHVLHVILWNIVWFRNLWTYSSELLEEDCGSIPADLGPAAEQEAELQSKRSGSSLKIPHN